MGQKQAKLSDMYSKTGEEDRLLTRDELLVALEALARILHKKNQDLELIVAGGFVSCSFFCTRDSTQDVDVIIRAISKQGRKVLRKAISTVSHKHNIPADWCNNHCELFFPARGPGDDPIVEESRRRALIIFERPGLRLIACSMRHMLRNKLRRMNDKDIGDAMSLFEFIQNEHGALSTKKELETYLEAEITDIAYARLIA